jgi:hypothetical protein
MKSSKAAAAKHQAANHHQNQPLHLLTTHALLQSTADSSSLIENLPLYRPPRPASFFAVRSQNWFQSKTAAKRKM